MNNPIDFADIFQHDENFKSIMRNMLQTALECSFDGVMITEASPGYPIVYVNPAFSAMTGYAFHELLGKSPALLQGEGTDPTVLADLKEKLETGQTFHGRAFNYRKDGTRFIMEWKIVPIMDKTEAISHYLAIQREITDGQEQFRAPDGQIGQAFDR